MMIFLTRRCRKNRHQLNREHAQQGGALIEVLIASALFLSVTVGMVGAFTHTESLWIAIYEKDISHKSNMNATSEQMMNDSYDQTWADVQNLGSLKPIM
jgi:Tfp pilus assembly protein PilV